MVWPTVPTVDLGSTKSSNWMATTRPSMKDSTKDGGRPQPPFVEPPRSAASFMDGCVVAMQVEDFGLPKSAMGMIGQTNKIQQF